VVGFIAWLLALGFPFLIYGPNTLFFFIYTWPFSSHCCPWRLSRHCAALAAQWQTPAQYCGHDCDGGADVWLLFLWLMGSLQVIIQTVTNNEIMFSLHGVYNNGQMWYICPRCRGILTVDVKLSAEVMG
jgi:hypothetical protein